MKKIITEFVIGSIMLGIVAMIGVVIMKVIDYIANHTEITNIICNILGVITLLLILWCVSLLVCKVGQCAIDLWKDIRKDTQRIIRKTNKEVDK